MESLIAANICSRPTRTVISVLAVGIGVAIMLIIGGIATGTLNDYLNRTVGVGADFILQPTGSSIFYAFSNAALPVKLADKVMEVPGVGVVAPVLAKFSLSDFGLAFGVDLATYNRLPGRLHMLKGQESLGPNEVIVDELYAKSHKVDVGMPLTIFNHQFTISGVCRSGAVVRVFMSLATLQEMNGTPDRATILFIKAAPKADISRLWEELVRGFPGYTLTLASDQASLLANVSMPGLAEFRFTVVFVSMLLSFIVILLAMYTTIFERTREIGILKSLGASRTFIVGMILKESAIVCILGALFGTGASALIRKVIILIYPTLHVSMSWGDVLRGCLLGLLGGTLGALYPAFKAARMDPVRALSYE